MTALGSYVQYSVFRRDTRNASGKAKYDVSDILSRLGFAPMYTPSDKRALRIVQQWASIKRLPEDSLMAVQYPANLDYFYRMLSKKQVESFAVIHDLESLRGGISLEEEVKTLGAFPAVISHNDKMTAILRDGGYKGKIVELGLFDYLAEDEQVTSDREPNTIAFAGNLTKASFLQELGSIPEIKFNVYGQPTDAVENMPPNVSYKGSFPSEEIAQNIDGAWGLIWDGDSLETCANQFGGYLKYNCPHKTSMYLVAERPVITWSGAAIAEIVNQRGLGVTVDSLTELPKAIGNVSAADYQTMLDNVRVMKQELVRGEHLTTAVNKTLELLGEKKDRRR